MGLKELEIKMKELEEKDRSRTHELTSIRLSIDGLHRELFREARERQESLQKLEGKIPKHVESLSTQEHSPVDLVYKNLTSEVENLKDKFLSLSRKFETSLKAIERKVNQLTAGKELNNNDNREKAWNEPYVKQVGSLEAKVAVVSENIKKILAREEAKEHLTKESTTTVEKKVSSLEGQVAVVREMEEKVNVLNSWMTARKEEQDEVNREGRLRLTKLGEHLQMFSELEAKTNMVTSWMTTKVERDMRQESSLKTQEAKIKDLITRTENTEQTLKEAKKNMVTSWMTTKVERDMRQESSLKTQEAKIKDLITLTENTKYTLTTRSKSLSILQFGPSGVLPQGKSVKVPNCTYAFGVNSCKETNSIVRNGRHYMTIGKLLQEGAGGIRLFLVSDGGVSSYLGETVRNNDVVCTSHIGYYKTGTRIWLEAEKTSGDASINWGSLYSFMV